MKDDQFNELLTSAEEMVQLESGEKEPDPDAVHTWGISEEGIEQAYWIFDAMCKGYKPYENRKSYSERDNFKAAIRSVQTENISSIRFQEGNVVALRSNPEVKMTVESVCISQATVNTVWFEGTKERRGSFHDNELKLLSSMSWIARALRSNTND